MPSQQQQIAALKEAQIQLALQAIQQAPKLSVRRATAIYKVSRTTLNKQRARQPSRVNTMANSQNLTNTKK